MRKTRAVASARRVRGAAALALVVLGLAMAIVGRQALARGALVFAASAFGHVRLSFDDARIGLHAAQFDGLNATAMNGEPIASIQRVSMRYDLVSALRGSQSFGISSIALVRPHVTIVRYADGTYNVPLPKGGRGTGPQGLPSLQASIEDGAIDVYDRGNVDVRQRHLSVSNLNATAELHAGGRSVYGVALDYAEGSGSRYPIRGAGSIDPAAGFSMQRWTAARLPIAGLVDFALNSPSLHLAAGELRGLDARYFSLPGTSGANVSHLAASAYLAGARVAIGGLAKPVRDVHGRVDVYDDGLLVRRLDGTVAGVPAIVSGGLYDLQAPSLRLAVQGSGDLAQLRTAFAQTAHLPMRGRLAFSLLAQGSPSKPLTWIAFDAPNAAYGQEAFTATHGLVAFDGREADVMHAQSHYGRVALDLRGRASVAPQPNAVQMLIRASAPPDSVPYLRSVEPALSLYAIALANGDDPKTIGMLATLHGSAPGQRLDATVNVDGLGNGTVGPLYFGNDRSSLYARVALDRGHQAGVGFVDAHNLFVAPLRARLDGAAIGDAQSKRIAVAARGRLHGPFGALVAAGTFSPRSGTLTGRYTGDLSLARALGMNVDARGGVDAPVAVAYSNGHAMAQIAGARFSGARIAGVPIQSASATIEASSPHDVRVLAARASIAGGNAVASGNMAAGGKIGISASGLDVATLRGAGLPLQAGRASFGATIAGTPAAPLVAGAFLLQNGRVDGAGVDASGSLAYARGTASIEHTSLRMGLTFVGLDGNVAGVTPGAFSPQYDLHAGVQSSDVGQLVALVRPGTPIDGSLHANLHVGGAGSAPLLSGTIDAPEGSVNGLGFRDMHATIRANAQSAGIGGGQVVIGSTQVAFSGDESGRTVAVAMQAPHADLADFNDFFDTADTFAGNGRLALSATATGGRLDASRGDAAFQNARFRRIELGSVKARWHSAGRALDGALAFGGPSGRVSVSGNVVPSTRAVNVRGTARAVDVGVWLPMLGFSAPVTGKLDADVVATGSYPSLDMQLRAGLNGGTIGRFPVQALSLVATADRGRGTIRSAVLNVPSLSSTASGSFGLRPSDLLSVTIHSTSPNVGALLTETTGKSGSDVAGALDSQLHVEGTLAQPRIADDVTLTEVRYRGVTVPRVAGTLDVTRTQVALVNGEADLRTGKAFASAWVPIVMTGSSVRIDPAAPVAGSFDAENLALVNLAGLFPKGTVAGGRIDGRVVAGGTLASPSLTGSLALTDGAFQGPMEKSPITGGRAILAFDGRRAALQSVHAYVGGGAVTGSGSATVADARSLQGVAFTLQARADNARLDMPEYFDGTLDGNVAVEKRATGPIGVSGAATVSAARIPLVAFLHSPSKGGAPPELPPVAFNHFTIVAGNDVRVQSAEVDIGGTGSATIDGTLASPRLSGAFHSTGGTIDFYRDFVLQRGTVAFDPNQGLIPDVDAVATTYVSDPETAVRLRVSGPATSMQLALSSDPSYDREQILGLLVGAQQFGAVRGVQSSNTASGTFSLPGAAQNVAFGQANQVFVRHLLDPASAALGSALGFTNLQITSDLQSGLGLNAVKAFGKNVNAVLADNFGYPHVQSVAIEAHPTPGTGLRLRMYSSQGISLFNLEQPQTVGLDAVNLNPMTSMASVGGSSGVDFSFVRRFW